MQAQLKRFCVVGLHDRRTIDVHIEDNKLILVGENGTGKSTFANLIYFFLTRQWRRLHEYRFEVIEASLGDVFFSVTPSEMDAYFAARKESTAQRRYLTPWRRSFIRRIQDYSLQELEHDNGAACTSIALKSEPDSHVRLEDVFFSVTPSEMDAYFAARKESTAQTKRRSFIRRIQRLLSPGTGMIRA